MSYLSKDDFLSIIRDHILDKITDDDIVILNQSIDSSVSQVKQYLFGRYDVDNIFSRTGNQRHPYLMRCVAYIARYIFMDRVPRNDSGRATKWEKDYDDTLAFLSKVRGGEIEMDLPRKNNEDGNPKTLFRSGSDPLRGKL